MRSIARWVLAAGFVLGALSACSVAEGTSEVTQVSPPIGVEPPTGDRVADLSFAGITYSLFDEGDQGCVALLIEADGLRPAVERLCSVEDRGATLGFSDSCGWSVETDSGLGYDRCDSIVPQVVYGIVSDPDIGFVCAARTHGTHPPVRLLSIVDDRFVLSRVLDGQVRAPFLFTHEGERYNVGVYDVDQSWFDDCEQLTPLFELTDTIYLYTIEFDVDLPAELRRGDVTIGLTGIDGEVQVAGDDAAPITLRIREDSSGIDVYLVDQASVTTYLDNSHPWSDDVRAVIRSEGACTEPIRVRLTIDPSVLDGDIHPVMTALVEANCT